MHRIVYYTDSKIVGGAENYLYLILKNLDRSKFKPYLICPGGKSHLAWRKKTSKLGVKIFPVATRNIFSFHKVRQTSQLIKKIQPHIIHLQFWSPYGCGVGLRCAKKYGKAKIFSTEHSFVPLEQAEWYLRPIKKMYHLWRKNIVDHPITVSYSSKKMMKKCQAFGDKKIWVIHNGIEINKSRSLKPKKIRGDFVNIVTVARLEEGKGHELLIKAIKEIPSPFINNLLFHFVGDGSLKSKLKVMARKLGLENKIVFWGHRDNVQYFLPHFNIFVFPSFSENFPFAVLEAMNARLPVVAFDVGGIKEALKNNKGGYLIKKISFNSLKRVIIKLIETKDKWDTFGEFNQRLVENKFSDKIMTKKIEKIYEKGIGRSI